jgi:putative transposase
VEPRKIAARALMAIIGEAWIGDVSTRRVDAPVRAGGPRGIAKSQVSKLRKDIDERVTGFPERPIEGAWRYLWLDATYLKVRGGGRIVSVAATIAVAVSTGGRREIIGLGIGPSEAEPFCSSFIKDLVRRGLKGVKRVIWDAHRGLAPGDHPRPRRDVAALSGSWDEKRPGACAKGQHTRGAATVRQAFCGPMETAAQTGRPVADQLRTRGPALAVLGRQRGRQRGGRARLYGLPVPAPDHRACPEPVGTLEQGSQTAPRCRRHRSERGQHDPADRCGPAQTE